MNTIKYIFALFLLATILISCAKKSDVIIGCNNSLPPVYLNFTVIDSSTGQDLFFSGSPVFGIKEMYFFKTKDIARKDTIRPTIEGSGASRSFKLSLDNTKLQDTLVMKVGNKPEGKLISKLKKVKTYVRPRLSIKSLLTV